MPKGTADQHPDRCRVGASGKICFSSDIENANYKVVKKLRDADVGREGGFVDSMRAARGGRQYNFFRCASHGGRYQEPIVARPMCILALQLPFLQISESMGNHDSKIMDAASVD